MANTATRNSTHESLSIRDFITQALENYFSQLGDQQPTELYDMVLAEVEAPLLDATMTYTKGNQSLAAKVLGISRGTLRKKLKVYGFLE